MNGTTIKFIKKVNKNIKQLELENLAFTYDEAVELTHRIENGEIKDIENFISGYKSYLENKK